MAQQRTITATTTEQMAAPGQSFISEESSWDEFWAAIANAFASLPPEVQEDYAARYSQPDGTSAQRVA